MPKNTDDYPNRVEDAVPAVGGPVLPGVAKLIVSSPVAEVKEGSGDLGEYHEALLGLVWMGVPSAITRLRTLSDKID